MGFIDNDEIETVRKQAFGMLLPARSRDGGDDALLAPESIGVFTQQSVLRGRAGDAEFVSNSSRHCPTSAAGVSTRIRSAIPRSRYSLSTIPASMVLPRPTSSARSTRP